jgi:Zn-finger nucleic acid-binding protein
MSYFIQRGTTVKGPFSQAKLKALVQEKKLKKNDGISESADGPWEPLSTAYKRIRHSAQSKTLPTIPTIDDWSVKRGLLGKYKINFVCPQCSTELNSDESDIGQRDYCPQCRFYFVLSSSVAEDISSDRERRYEEEEKKSKEKQQRKLERQQEGERKQQLKEDQRRQAEQTRLEELARQQKLEEQMQEEEDGEDGSSIGEIVDVASSLLDLFGGD